MEGGKYFTSFFVLNEMENVLSVKCLFCMLHQRFFKGSQSFICNKVVVHLRHCFTFYKALILYYFDLFFNFDKTIKYSIYLPV